MNQTLVEKILESWKQTENAIFSKQELLEWISQINCVTRVSIERISFCSSDVWSYRENIGAIAREDNAFFRIGGIRRTSGDKEIEEQPIIIQREIGYLGIICKEIDGTLYFLMQAKIEPGNVNTVQISPTIQATKSNFMCAHGGKQPLYFEYFVNCEKYDIIADQIQSEQASKFYKKRNRNIIIKIDNDVEVYDNFKWMTLGQIKQLMKYDNLVNMDTRTVLACIPFSLCRYSDDWLASAKQLFSTEEFYNSFFDLDSGNSIKDVFCYFNGRKMIDTSRTEIVDIHSLNNCKRTDMEYVCFEANIKLIFCHISIEGREVTNWTQPLMESISPLVIGLFTCFHKGKQLFLVRAVSEIGCFDMFELGASVQQTVQQPKNDLIACHFFNKLERNEDIVFKGIFSEEGGRFYHEQNMNVIIRTEKDVIDSLSSGGGYFWVDFNTLNTIVQFNNYLNIHLRNLLSLLDL